MAFFMLVIVEIDIFTITPPNYGDRHLDRCLLMVRLEAEKWGRSGQIE